MTGPLILVGERGVPWYRCDNVPLASSLEPLGKCVGSAARLEMESDINLSSGPVCRRTIKHKRSGSAFNICLLRLGAELGLIGKVRNACFVSANQDETS